MSKGKPLETFRTAYVNYYKKTYKPDERKLSLEEYLKLMNGFSEFLMNAILDGKIVYIPGRLGAIQVIGKKRIPKVTENGISGLSINWKETLSLWDSCKDCKEREQKVYNFNEHSNGLAYRFVWSRIAVTLETKFTYTYVPNRQSKRDLAQKIKEGKEYLILENRNLPYTKTKNKLKTRHKNE